MKITEKQLGSERPLYQTPIAMPLGGISTARGRNQCQGGSAAGGKCQSGSSAGDIKCQHGTSAAVGRCQAGATAASGTCRAGVTAQGCRNGSAEIVS